MLVATVEHQRDGWHVTVSRPYGNGWGVGVTFPTERGAQMVATAIELAQRDELRV